MGTAVLKDICRFCLSHARGYGAEDVGLRAPIPDLTTLTPNPKPQGLDSKLQTS